MIDTVIFDIGNVLTEWHWAKTFEEWFGAERVDALAKATVQSREWGEIDRGVLNEEEMIALLTKNDPRYAAEIERIVRENHKLVTMYPYAVDWIRGLKKAGYKVYILSNFGSFSFERAKPSFPFLQEVDGALISYEVRLIKPDRAIYEAICSRFSIVPERAVFLDDNAANIEGARAFGMAGIVVENREQTDEALRALGVRYE